MDIQAIKVQRLYRLVADQLTDLIRSGELTAGERLPSERALAERFAVSRPTIREAMLALEIGGWVEIRSGAGVFVLDQEPSALPLSNDRGPGPFEILEARLVLETEACAQAATRLSEQQLGALQQLLEDMAQENLHQQATEHADQRFHCFIAEATGNSAIAMMVSWLWQLRNDSEISTRFHQRLREEGSRPIIADHQQILAALQQRDPDEARAAMRDHLQRVINSLLDTND